MPFLVGCPAPKGGYIAAGSNVVGGCTGCSSTGWMDCAKKCGANPSCKAWTLHKPSNGCWLKTNYKSIGNHVNWSWGMPCKGPGKKIKKIKNSNLRSNIKRKFYATWVD